MIKYFFGKKSVEFATQDLNVMQLSCHGPLCWIWCHVSLLWPIMLGKALGKHVVTNYGGNAPCKFFMVHYVGCYGNLYCVG